MRRYQFQSRGTEFMVDYSEMKILVVGRADVWQPLSWLSEDASGYLTFGYDPAIKDFFGGSPGGEFFPKGCLLYAIPAVPRKQMFFYEVNPETKERKKRGLLHSVKPEHQQEKIFKSSNGNRGKKI